MKAACSGREGRLLTRAALLVLRLCLGLKMSEIALAMGSDIVSLTGFYGENL
jgi:hypothetical protein